MKEKTQAGRETMTRVKEITRGMNETTMRAKEKAWGVRKTATKAKEKAQRVRKEATVKVREDGGLIKGLGMIVELLQSRAKNQRGAPHLEKCAKWSLGT